ncbi:unnamed protein product [Ectocarpus sp. 6 AP-2014]
MSRLKMFECLGDCADFDLVNGCVDSNQAQQANRSPASQQQLQERGQQGLEGRQQQQQPEASDSDSHSSRSYSDDEEGSFYSQDEDNVDGDDVAGQGEGGYDSAGAYNISASSPATSMPPLQSPPAYDGSVAAADGDLQALSVSAALRAREHQQEKNGGGGSGLGGSGYLSDGSNWKSGGTVDTCDTVSATTAATTNGGGGGGSGGSSSAGGVGAGTDYPSSSSSTASAAAQEAAAAGRRASSSAKDAVAAAAAAADARTQEEAEAAADRAAKAAANAAAGAAGAARAASAAGRAAAAEQAARGAMEMSGGTNASGRPMRRSASVPDDEGDDDADPSGRISSVRSTPGSSEMMAAPTPGRESEGERTWIMAKRVASNWEKEDESSRNRLSAPEASQPSPAVPKTFVSTRLRHLRLSPDGTTLVVKSEQGGVDHELALDELLEVHETPSEESVTLMGTDIEIRIAFKGQAKALKQFRNMLVPTGTTGTTTPSEVDADRSTTVTTIKDPMGSSGGAAPPSPAEELQAREAAAAGGPSTNGAYLDGRNTAGSNYQQQHGLGGIDEGSTYAREAPSSRSAAATTPAGMGKMTSSVTNSVISPGSSVSGWGSVMGPGDGNLAAENATQRQLADITERAGAAQKKALARSGSGGTPRSAEHASNSTAGSTFADARERELVIAALQNAETMPAVEREAKLHLVKYEQAGFVRGYEALCDQQQVRLRKRPEFADLENVGVEEGLADPNIVLRQPNRTDSVDAHYADAVRAKAALDSTLDRLTATTNGLWVRPVPVKSQESIKRKASDDYGGELRRVLDMARTSVICETPELVRELTDKLKACKEIGRIGRMKNGFGSTAVGRGGYRDIKVTLMPLGVDHYAEVQVHLREFYELNSRSHEVYEWARGVDLPDGTTPHLLFRNLTPDVQEEMTQLVKDDWMGLRRILPELLQATEQFNEAEPLLRQNVADAEQRWKVARDTFGEGHLHEITCAQGVAMALNNLALALKGRGDVHGAEPLLRRALQMSIESQGAEHPEVATRLNSLALLLASDGRVAEAEGLHRQALDIAGKVYGPEHADVATYLNNLARVLKAQDKLAEAEPLQRSALAIGERMLGTNHSDVATYYNNLSRLVRAAGKLEEAEPLQRRAVEIGEQVLGPNSPDLATWVNNLGRLLMARKKLEEAEKVQERAVTIAENVYGPHHAQVARARKNLTKVRWALGKAGRSR